MALFKRKEKAQPEAYKIDFEGQTPIAEMDFRHEYENLLEALAIQDQGKSRWRPIAGSAMLVFFGALALPTIYAFSKVWAVLAVFIVILLVAHSLFGNTYTRSFTAKKMAEEEKDIVRHLKIFRSGIQVTQSGQEMNAPYRLMKMYESDRQFTAQFGPLRMLAFPKKEMGDNVPLYREVFVTNLGKRFYKLDAKGRIVENEKK